MRKADASITSRVDARTTSCTARHRIMPFLPMSAAESPGAAPPQPEAAALRKLDTKLPDAGRQQPVIGVKLLENMLHLPLVSRMSSAAKTLAHRADVVPHICVRGAQIVAKVVRKAQRHPRASSTSYISALLRSLSARCTPRPSGQRHLPL